MDPLLQRGAELVLALGAASAGSRAAAGRAEALVPTLEEADWALADRWARALGAEGVLARALSEDCPAREAVAGRWQRLGMVADFRQARLQAMLGEALDVLGSAGIPTMLLKGAALASSAYPGGMPDRPMADVDVLVPEGSAADGYERLRSAGWTASPAPGRAAFYAGHHHLPQLRHEASGLILELHRALLPPGHPFAWDEAEVRAGARPVTVCGMATSVPGPEELLLHAAVHHAWANELRTGSWSWMRDLVVLAPQVEWERVIRLARARRAETCLHWALRLGRRLGATSVPVSVLRALHPPLTWWPEALERHLVLDAVPPVDTPRSVALRRVLWSAAVRPGASGHGSARPWRSGAPADPKGAGEPGSAGVSGALKSLGREAGRLEVWLRWLRRVAR